MRLLPTGTSLLPDNGTGLLHFLPTRIGRTRFDNIAHMLPSGNDTIGGGGAASTKLPTFVDAIRQEKGSLIIRLNTGSLDDETGSPCTFCDEVWNLSGNTEFVILDLTNVDHVDSTMISKIMLLEKQIRGSGGQLGICGIQERVLRSFRNLGLDQIISLRSLEQGDSGLLEELQAKNTNRGIVIDRRGREIPVQQTYVPTPRAVSLVLPKEPVNVTTLLDDTSSVEYGSSGDPSQTGVAYLTFKPGTRFIDREVNEDTICEDLLRAAADSRFVIVDLTNVTSISDESIGQFLALNKRLSSKGSLAFCGSLQAPVLESFKVKALIDPAKEQNPLFYRVTKEEVIAELAKYFK